MREIIKWTAIVLLIANLIALTIALTSSNPENPLKEYRLILGISFITIGGFLRESYKRNKKINKNVW